MSREEASSELLRHPRLNWLNSTQIKPYVFVRPENQIADPGRRFQLNWFTKAPVLKNPLLMDEVDFANQILRLESKAFAATNMPMPRWVFYDCALMPGFVAGFALHHSAANREVLDLLQPDKTTEWLPISLFIIIPTMDGRAWVAHNLCSINSLVSEPSRLYGLGFLTKAYGLWYANVEVLCGMTQWGSPAMRLHTHYGDFEVLTAYTPVHSYSRTVTYRMVTDTSEWKRFFFPPPGHPQGSDFERKYEYAGFDIDPTNDASLIAFQRRLEIKENRYYLNPQQLRQLEKLDAVLKVYQVRAAQATPVAK
jgi:hypothetical protein